MIHGKPTVVPEQLLATPPVFVVNAASPRRSHAGPYDSSAIWQCLDFKSFVALLQGSEVGEVSDAGALLRALKRVLPTSPEEAELICEILADE